MAFEELAIMVHLVMEWGGWMFDGQLAGMEGSNGLHF